MPTLTQSRATRHLALAATLLVAAVPAALAAGQDVACASSARPLPARCVAARTPAEAVADARAEQQATLLAELKRRARKADEQLLGIYPDLATYWGKRAAELEVVNSKLLQANARLRELLAARRVIDQKAEFYKGRPLPPDLQIEVAESDGAFMATTYVFRNLESEVGYIVAKYQPLRERLDRLWGGAEPGSLGLLEPTPGAPR